MANQKEKVKRKSLSFNQKVEILERLESGEKSSTLAEDFQVSKALISLIKKEKENIMRKQRVIVESGGSGERKRYQGTEEQRMEQKLYTWFKQRRSMGFPVTGPILQQQATFFYQQLGGSKDFKASSGWLTLFKKRHGIRLLSMQGEKLSADSVASEGFKEKLSNVIHVTGIDIDCIYNCDETGLYWKVMPDKTFVLRNEKTAPGRKKPKERVTIMLCTNASGTHKIPLFMVGKSKQPRCFKNVKHLPIVYESQENAWMTRELMIKWYTSVFLPEVQKKHDLHYNTDKKIILIMDNAACHPAEEVFNEIFDSCTVIFLPPNVTSLIQPLDQGIIEKFKKCYRNQFLSLILASDPIQGIDFLKSMNLLNCCNICAFAWTQVKQNDIRNCWKSLIPLERDLQVQTIDISDFNALCQKIPFLSDTNEQTIRAWLEIDSAEIGWQPLSDENILFGTNENGIIEEFDKEMESEAEDEESVCAMDAATALTKTIKWYQQQETYTLANLSVLQELQNLAIVKIMNEA